MNIFKDIFLSAVEFSFLLAVPTMIAASGLDILKSNFFQYSFYEYLLLLGSFFWVKFVLKFP